MHKLLRRYLFITASILMLCGVIAPEKADALGWPHNDVGSCSACHSGGFEAGLFDFTPNCLNCHDSGSVDPKAGDAKLLPFALNDAAQPSFGRFTAVATPKNISHAWGVPYNNITAGASKPYSDSVSRKSTTVSCGSCHWAHASHFQKALRIPTDASASSLQRNAICVTCHSARNVTKASGNAAPKTNSHPVNIQFTDVTSHNYPPNIDAAYSSISSSVLKLFSTVGGGDTVHCKTCHGVHYTDSNPYTNDAPLANLSTGDGYLLRRYNDSTMCNDCHNFQGHKTMTCRNCHKPHNVGNNANLIMRNISTPGAGTQPALGNVAVIKLYTSRGFVTATRNGTGICEVCHNLDNASPAGGVFADWSSDHYSRVGGMANAPNYNCMECHPHQVGTGTGSFAGAGGCNDCHGTAPMNDYSGIDGFADREATGVDYRSATSGYLNEANTPHYKHANVYPFGVQNGSGYGSVCRACHDGTVGDHNTTADRFQDVGFGLYTTTGDGRNYDGISGGNTRLCSSIYCHSNSDPWDGTAAYTFDYKNPTWGSPGTLGGSGATCNRCHLYPPATNVHAKHTDAPYSFDCAYCHSGTVTNYSTISNTSNHVNKVKDVAFSGTATANSSNPTYNASTHKCSSTWCHGNDPMMNNTTVVWNGASACGSCHDVPQTSSSHGKHVSTYGFDCADCHEQTMDDTSNIAIGNYTTHVDGVKSVDFGLARSNTIDNTGGAPYVDGTDECDNIYCHSRGTDLVAPFNTSTSQPMSVATWGGTGTCNYCHGNSTYSGYTAAMPNYASGSPKANSHVEHVIDNGFGCKVCHNTTLTDNWTIGSTALHVDMTRDVSIVSAYGGTWDGTKCTNVSCHGSNNSPNWGVTAYCKDCHYSTTSSDQDDDTTWNNFSGAAAKIYSSDFKDTGHGKPSGSYDYTNLPAANKACTDCHDEPVKHGNATIPFRTKWSGDLDTFCLSCHGTGAQLQGAFATSSGIQNHSYFNISTNGYKNLTTWRFAPKCVDCHDPHGDSNLGMIHDKVQTGGSDAKGRPAAYVNGSTVVFTKFTGGAGSFSYATVDKKSICRACHSRTEFHRNNGGLEHNSGVKCINCHKHSTGFTPAGCELGCHGYPPRNPAQLLYSSANADSSGTQTGSVTAGAHETHVETAGQVCDICHYNGMGTTQLEDGKINLFIKAYTQYSTGSYDGQAAVGGGFYGYSGPGAGGATGTKTCSSVKCHGDGWLTGGADTTPVWDSPSTGDCGNCHGAKKAAGSWVGQAPYLNSNAHLRHAGTTAGQYDIMCKTCHNATVLGTSTTLATTHVNAQAQAQFDTAQSRTDEGGTYTGDLAVNSGWGACSDTYCHSEGSRMSNYSAPNESLDWSATSSCNSCHGSTGTYGGYTASVPNYASGSPKVNSHIEHVVDNGINCSSCHYDTTTDGRTINNVTSHVNKNYDVVIPYRYDVVGDNNYSSPTCASVDCHQSASANWGGATPSCETCHSTTSDTDNFVFNNFSSPNTVAAKIKSAEWTATGHGTTGAGALASGNNGPNLVCLDCHDGTNTEHGEAGKYFRLSNADTDTLCLSCHGSGAALTGGPKIGNVTGIQNHTYANMSVGGYKDMSAWNFTPKCVDCHDPHGDKNRYMMHTFAGYSGSDGEGRPSKYNVQLNFSTVGGGLMNWSSYVNVSGGAGTGLCQRCHGTRVLNFDKGGEFNQTHNNGQRCTACHAHNTGFTPAGGCPDCHFDTADVDDFVVGGAQAKINQQQYTSVGHGKDSIALDCLHCHDETIPHATAGRYFRLYTSDTNALCAGCHGDTGAATYQAWTSGVDGWVVATKTGIFTHNSSNAQGNNDFEIKCVDCHDPHGDNNIFMMHSTFALPNADNSYTPSDVFGIPTSTEWSNVDFTTNANGFGYATSFNGDNIQRACNVCHSRTENPGNSDERFQQDMLGGNPNDVHNTSTKCVNCHAHTGGFKGVACDGCHGNPPVGVTTLIGGTGTDQSQPSTSSSTAGAHDKHVTVLTDSDKCERCHDTGMSVTGGVLNGLIDVEFAGGAQNLYTTGGYDGQNAVQIDADYSGYDGDVPTTTTSYTCTTVKCHGGGAWLTKDTGGIVNPVWNGSIVCGDCHGAKKQAGSGTWPTSDGHAKHAGTGVNQYDFMCQTCHVATLQNNTTLSSTHVNEQSQVSFDFTNDNRVAANSAYDGGSVVNSGVGKCNLTYCHSDGNRFSNFSAPNLTAPQWNAGTLGCDACHAGTGTGPDYADDAPKANSHATHVVTKGYVCSDCHQSTTADNLTINDESIHVNKFYNISVDSAYAVGAGLKRYSSTYDATGGTCKNVYCHGAEMGSGATGLDITPQWGDSTTAECGDCHAATGGTITQGGHQMHVGGTPTYYVLVCGDCHTSEAAATHVDGTRTFIGDVGLGATAACATCHDYNGSDAAQAKFDWYSTTKTRACGTAAACHSGAADESGMPERHLKHVDDAGYNFGCVRCHETTVSDDTTIDGTTGRANHADGTKTLDFDSYLGNDNAGTFNGVSRMCQNLYCHSNGTDLIAPYAATAISNYTADWDDATGGCKYCHGSDAYGDWKDAMPNYVSGSPKVNSHVEHVIDNGIQCRVCHASTTSDDVSISNDAVHVNGFYNVSVINTYVSASPFSYNTGTKVCSNVKCHGGQPTPAWGAAANCTDCHYSTSDIDDFTFGGFSGTAALVSQKQYTSVGHGRNSGTSYPKSGNSGAGQSCTANCHDSGVAHGTSTNPFRLTNADTIAFCNNVTCHDPASITHHATDTTAGRWDFKMKCIDCHDPHGDNNIFMVHSTIAAPNPVFHGYSSSDQYGVPYPDLTLYNVDFTNNAAGSDYGDPTASDGHTEICNVCHTRTDQGGGSRYQRDMAAESVDTHNSGALCNSCHGHNSGFEGLAGESPGGVACGTCHSALLNPMQNNASYHHYMQNDGTTYPSDLAPTAQDVDKKCLMCHVDHDIFSPANNPANGVRARNLRAAANNTPNSGNQATFVPTDFYPQNPKYDSDTNPFTQADGNNGVCISCHTSNQTKNQTGTDRYNDGSTNAKGFTKFLYYSSSHNFQVITGINNFGDGSSFRANCAKCHGSSDNNTMGAQSGSATFGVHNKDAKSLINSDTGTLDEVDISGLCFKCHSNDARAAGGPGATYDFYSSVVMNPGAKLIKTAVTAKTYGHPQGGNPTAHDPNEYSGVASGWNAAAQRHVECTDCHNTHGGNANIVRNVGSPSGNGIAGAQKGVWGVSMTHGAPGTVPSFTPIPEVTMQAELCLKCHSAFGYAGSPPVIPSGAPDPAGVTVGGLYDTIVVSELETDQSVEFNPNNPGYHPVLAPGRNQPGKAANGAWPATTNVEYVDPYTGYTSFRNVSGLSWTFVPPWNQGSTMGCSDCHAADNTGVAVSSFGAHSTVAGVVGDWDADAVAGTLDLNDGNFATATGTTTKQRLDVTGASYPGNATKVEVALHLNHSLGKNKSFPVEVWKGGASIFTGNVVSSSTGGSFVRGAVDITTAMTTNTCLDATCIEGNIEIRVGSAGVGAMLTKASVDAYYPFTEKLRGPHGSLNKWILETANKGIHFKVGGSYVYPNASIVSGSTEEKVFCYNCHRRDVYGCEGGCAPPYEPYSRLNHNNSGSSAHLAVENPWGIWCMNCHGGRGPDSPNNNVYIGGIHGIYASSTAYGTPFFGAASSKVMNRPLGVRLLYGATSLVAADTTDVYCYTVKTADATGSCTSEGGSAAGAYSDGAGNTTPLNYTYTAW